MVIEYNVPNAVKTSIASRIGKAPVAKSKFQSVRRGGNVQNNQGKAGGAGQRRGGDGPRRGGGGRPGQRTGGRSRVPKKTPTQAELDADLDAFNIKVISKPDCFSYYKLQNSFYSFNLSIFLQLIFIYNTFYL